MSDGSTSPEATALVDALDARARQAGSDGAATLIRGVLGTLSESLGALDDRLDRMEAVMSDGSGASRQTMDAVASNLTSLNVRIARLEEAFVQALEESGDGAVAVVEQVRAVVTEMLAPSSSDQPPQAMEPDPRVVDGLSSIEDRLQRFEATLEEHRQQLTERLTAIEQAAPVEIPPFPEPAPAVDLEPVVDRLRVLDGRLAAIEARPEPTFPDPPQPPPPPDLGPVVTDALAPVLARLSQLDEQVTRLADAPPPVVEVPTDPDVITRLESLAETVGRDEGSARLIAAVEERITAAVRAVTDRVAGTGADIQALRDHRDTVGHRLDEVAGSLTSLKLELERGASAGADRDTAIEDIRSELRETGERWPAVQTAQAEVQRVMADLSSALAGLRPLVDAQRTAAERLEKVGNDVEQLQRAIGENVRREAELLTQRVASLAVGVEATRVMCEQLAEAHEQSIGRKAGEVGRRLAQDLGLRSRRGGPTRNDRELGPGAT